MITPFRGLTMRWTTSRHLRAALLLTCYSTSQPPRTDCPNLAASHLCRSIPWAWASTPHSLYNVIQWSVHIPELHSATKSESSKDRGWKHTINNDHQIALELWHKSRARLTRRVPTCAFVCAARMRLPPAPRPRVPPCAGVGSAPIVSRLALVLLAGQLEKERNAAFNTAILKENGSILFFFFRSLIPSPATLLPFLLLANDTLVALIRILK